MSACTHINLLRLQNSYIFPFDFSFNSPIGLARALTSAEKVASVLMKSPGEHRDPRKLKLGFGSDSDWGMSLFLELSLGLDKGLKAVALLESFRVTGMLNQGWAARDGLDEAALAALEMDRAS